MSSAQPTPESIVKMSVSGCIYNAADTIQHAINRAFELAELRGIHDREAIKKEVLRQFDNVLEAIA